MTKQFTVALIAGLAIFSQGCSRVTCGSGTDLVDRICEAVVQDIGTLECGPGTVEKDQQCVAEPKVLRRCPAGTVLRAGVCIPWNYDEWLNMPFEVDEIAYVGQGHHGYFSHNGASLYAVDFSSPEGTPFTAVRAGRVMKLREDSDSGCDLPECGDQANYVEIDHGDGSIGRYYHLELDGVDVEVGDWVFRGQVLGRTGNTGFSTGPHLHLSVTDFYRMSVPVLFRELEDISDGIVSSGMEILSTNVLEESKELSFSDCGRDTFLHMGVALEPGTPCTVASAGQAYSVRGRVVSEPEMAIVTRYDIEAGEWVRECVSTDADGWFETELTYADDSSVSRTYLMISKAGGDCWAVQGWDQSLQVSIIP